MPNTPPPTTVNINTSRFETNRRAHYDHQYAVYKSTSPSNIETGAGFMSSFKIDRPSRRFITHAPQPPRIPQEVATQPTQQNRIDSSCSVTFSSFPRRQQQESEDIFSAVTNPLLLNSLSRSSGSGRTPSPFIFEPCNEASFEKPGVPIPTAATSTQLNTDYLSPSSLPLRQSNLQHFYLQTTSPQPPPLERSSLRSSRIPVPLKTPRTEVKEKNELVKNELIAAKREIVKDIERLKADLLLLEACINMSQANLNWLMSRLKDISSDVTTRENNKSDLSRIDATLSKLNVIEKDLFINNQIPLLSKYCRDYRDAVGRLQTQEERFEQIEKALSKY